MPDERSNPTNQPAKPQRRRWRTVIFGLWTGLVFLAAVAVVVLRLFHRTLADNQMPSLETGVINVSTYAVIALTIIGLMIWTALFSRRSRWGRVGLLGLILAVVATPIVLFQPIFDGALGLRGLRPRFWGANVSLDGAMGVADLRRESPRDFPQFLGPRRLGTYDAVELSADWNDRPPKLIWKQPIGPAWSGFATRNGFAVTMQQVGEQECVSCFRVDDGKPVWNYCIRRRHEDILGGIGPRSTPTIHEGRVYALGALGNLCCLDGATGKPFWEVDLLKLAGIPVAEHVNGRGEAYQVEQSNVAWGRAASPLIYKSLVIVPLSAKSTLVALDRRTGERVWFGGDQPPGYSSPSLAEINGKTQIVIVNENSVTGHDPENGTELWYYQRNGSSSGDANTSQATPVGENLMLLSKGYGLGGELIRLEPRDGGTFTATSVWKNRRVLETKLTNPVVRDGYAYSLSSEILECADLKTGERRWRASKRFGHGQILLVGKYVLVHAEDGELVLAEANPTEYREFGRIPTISGVCWNTMGMYGDCVLVRSEVEAACLRLPTVESPPSTLSLNQTTPSPSSAAAARISQIQQ